MTALPAKQPAPTTPATGANRPPSPFSEPWLSNLRRGLGSANGRPLLMSGFTMTPQMSAAVKRHCSTWRQQITASPDERAQIGAELAKLLLAYPSQDPGVTVSLRVEAYAVAIGRAPAWIVAEARYLLLTGKADIADWNRSFTPSPTQFGDLVRGLLRPYERDLADLEALTLIEPNHEPSAAERTRVAAGLEALRAEIQPATSPLARKRMAEEGLREKAVKQGVDFDGAMAAIPDADPKKVGTFAKAEAPTINREAAE